jgi:hypothetical protein
MARKVKCRYCGNSIDITTAYKIVVGKVNRYFCNKNEYEKVCQTQQIKDKTYDVIYDIFGYKVTNTILYKEIHELSLVYAYEKIYAYLSDNIAYLKKVIQNKEFQSEYAQIRYFAAILKNNLADFHYEEKTPVIKEVDIDMSSCNYKRKTKRKTLAEYEQEVGDYT